MTLFFIIILLIILFWPWISRWIQRYMARRAEDMVRRMAGMPSRKEEERRRKQQQKEYQRRQTQEESFHRQYRYTPQDTDGVKSMQEYAEDVEFTEIKEYSENTVFEQDDKEHTRIYRESQVSDVEFTETKN